MRLRVLYAAVCACVLALAACSAPTAGSAADETALRAMGGKYADAFNKRDAAALAALVTDDYQAVSPDGTEVKGRAAFEESEKKSAAERTGMQLTLDVKTTIMKWAGADHAVLGGTWTMAGLPAGMGGDKGAWSGTAEKGADGQWRLATGLVAQYVAPPAPMPMPTPTPTPTPTPKTKPAPKKGRGR